MKMRDLILAVAAVATAASSLLATSVQAQAKEQFFPLLSYRTGPYAPNGIPWANGKQDYLKLINARDGGINGVKVTFEECETGYATDRGVECYERLKGRPGVTLFDPQATGITFALTEKAPVDKMPLVTLGYGLSVALNLYFNTFFWALTATQISFFVFALGSPDGWIAVIGPASILYLLLRVTGIPLTEEQSLRSRGDAYRRYQQTTSAFIPWFPQKLPPSQN